MVTTIQNTADQGWFHGIFPTPEKIQMPLPLPETNNKRGTRGNPGFISKWLLGATKAIRVPIAIADPLLEIAKQWDRGADPEIVAPQIAIPEKTKPIEVTPTPIPCSIPSGFTGLAYLSPELLTLAPKKFQYKIVHGATGSTGSLSGVAHWNDSLAGIILVWYDPQDQLIYVINGHNRVTLAKKLGVESLAVRFIDASDALMARSMGALANIAEGNGTALDAGKFLRDSGYTLQDIKNLGLPMAQKMVTQGYALSKLDPVLFDRVIQGDLDMTLAIQIGEGLDSFDLQHKFLELVKKEKRGLNSGVVAELIQIVSNALGDSVLTQDLFGGSWAVENYAIETAKIQAHIIQNLGRDRRIFGGCVKNATLLERGNNAIDRDRSQDLADVSHKVLVKFQIEKFLVGPVATIIKNHAKALHHGDHGALDNALTEIIKALA